MSIEYKGIEGLPESIRNDMVEFLDAKRSDNNPDIKLREFINGFITHDDPDYINVNDFKDSKYLLNEINKYKAEKQEALFARLDNDSEVAVIEGDAPQEDGFEEEPKDLLDGFGDDEEEDNTSRPDFDDDGIKSDESAAKPIPPRFQLSEQEQPVSNPNSSASNVSEEVSENLIFDDIDPAKASLEERLQKIEEENRRLKALLAQTGGEGQKAEGNIGSIISKGGASAVAGVAEGAGALVEGGGKLIGSILNKTARVIDKDGNATSIMNTLQGKSKSIFDMGMRKALTGQEEDGNVIDIRNRLNKHIASQTQEETERKLAMMRDGRLNLQRNLITDKMLDIDSGNIAKRTINNNLVLDDVVASAKNGSPTEKMMAAAILSGNKDLPNISMEIDLVSKEYQSIADQLSNVNARMDAEGWSPAEVSSAIAEPVQEWIDTRKEEDNLLFDLAEVSNAEESPEELERKRRAMEDLVEMIKQLIQSLFARNVEQAQEQSSAPTMSR